MGKFKRILGEVSKAIGMLMGFLIAAYSWATTVSDMKPIFGDWRIGVGFGISIFFISAYLFVYKLFGDYTWIEPEITLSPKVLPDYSDGSFYQNARLNIYNNEQIEITDCFATLVSVADYIEYNQKALQDHKASNQRLRWSQAGFSNEKCEVTIPPKDSREVNLVHTKRNLEYLLCSKTVSPNFMLGARLFLVKIRVDGKFNGKVMKPLIFDGYLYNGSELYFEEGDWKKDKRISMPKSEKGITNEKKQKPVQKKNSRVVKG